MIWINSWGLAAQHQIIGTPYMEKPYPWRKDMLPNTVFFSMSKLFTWEIIAQRQILQARHLRKNVSKIQIPSLQEISKQEIQRFMKFTVLWVRVLTYAPSLFAVKTNLSSLILLKIFHVQHSTASWLNLILSLFLWSYKTIQLCN